MTKGSPPGHQGWLLWGWSQVLKVQYNFLGREGGKAVGNSMRQNKEPSEKGQVQVPKAEMGEERGVPSAGCYGATEGFIAAEWPGLVRWNQGWGAAAQRAGEGLSQKYPIFPRSLWALRFRAKNNSGVSWGLSLPSCLTPASGMVRECLHPVA